MLLSYIVRVNGIVLKIIWMNGINETSSTTATNEKSLICDKKNGEYELVSKITAEGKEVIAAFLPQTLCVRN